MLTQTCCLQTLVKIGNDTGGKATWVRGQIMHPDRNGEVKEYPWEENCKQEGVSLKLKRMGGELYPHLLPETKVDALGEIAGSTVKNGCATVKFNLDSSTKLLSRPERHS
jgi:hypothetical protein